MDISGGSHEINSKEKYFRELQKENLYLKNRLAETEETLYAIQSGSVDALVINNDQGNQVFTLQSADYPYRILVENMFEGAATISTDFEIVYCNKRLSEMLELHYQQIIGKHMESFVYSEDLLSFHQLITEGQNKTISGEIRLTIHSGRIIEVLMSCTPLNFENSLVCLVFAELTQIKKVEAELKRINEHLDTLVQQRTAELQSSEEKWVTTLSSIGDAVIATNKKGRITFMNSEAENLTGWRLSEAVNLPIKNVLRLTDAGKNIPVKKNINRILSERKTLGLAKGNFLISKNKTQEIPIDERAAPIKGEGGQTMGIVYVFRDISDRIKAEQELRESEERFRVLVTGTSNLVFHLSPDWSRIHLMLTADEGAYEASFRDYMREHIPVDFQHHLMQSIQKAIKTRTVFESEHPVYNEDRSINWMFTRAVPIISEKNEITEWFGTSTDITSRKRAEEALKESERRYSALFANKLNAMAHCRIITDQAGKPVDFLYLQVNEAFEQIMEIKKEVVEGKTIREIYPSIEDFSFDYIGEYGKVALDNKEIKYEEFFEGAGKYLSVYAYCPQKREFIAIFSDITQRKLTEKALIESENKFSVMFQAAPIGISLLEEESGTYYDVNQAWLDLFRFAHKNEVIGKKTADLNIIRDPERRNLLLKNYKKKGKIRNYEQSYFDRKGLVHHVLINIDTIEIKGIKYTLSTLEDISDRKKIENELRESRQRWATTLTSIGDAVISTDTEGKITFMNKAAEKITQWQHEEVLQQPVSKFLQILDERFRQVKFKKIADLIIDGVIDNRTLVDREGRRIPIEYNISPIIDTDGQKKGMVLIFRDVSQRKEIEKVIRDYNIQLEKTVKERTAELEQEKERAESADKLKTTFLLNMSHELRTPLNSIIGFSGILLNQLAGPLNPEQEKQLEMVRASGRHLLSLISDILDISKIEAGELKPDFSIFNIRDVIEDVLNLISPQAKNKKLPLIFHKSRLPDIFVNSDKIRIRQVLINLVSNAVKFTEKGKVEIRCAKVRNSILKVEVSDTGIGIRKEDLDKLFNPFIQLENNLTRKFEGSGLGLSISKKIMDMLGGTISVISEHGFGSTFCITLPLINSVLPKTDLKSIPPI